MKKLLGLVAFATFIFVCEVLVVHATADQNIMFVSTSRDQCLGGHDASGREMSCAELWQTHYEKVFVK